MLKGLGFLALRALPFLLLATPAWAGSTLYINSQPGDTVGGGQQATYTDSDGTFSVSGTASAGITIAFQQTGPHPTWTVQLAAPQKDSLADGNYDGAQRYPAYGPLLPGIYVYPGIATGDCTTVNGRFIVRDIEVDGSGNVTSFAADFEQHCKGAASALLGAIRYNSSVPVSVDAPTADAGGYQIVAQGNTVTVDGSLSESGNGTITVHTWTQLSGPSVTLADPNAVTTAFAAPSVGLGGADVVLQLEVDNSLGDSSTATVTIHVANPADPVTELYVTGDPTDRITQGNTYSFNSAQARFTVAQINGTQEVSVGVNGGIPGNFSASFEAPPGQSLHDGVYDVYEDIAGTSASSPWISISGEGESCFEDDGRFVILDLQRDGNGNITSLAVDFEQYCDGSIGMLHGVLRYNSTVPVDAPVAAPVVTQIMTQGETVALSAATWVTGTDGDAVASYQWTQLSGPTVTLSDANAPSPTFTAPDVSAGGADITFQLTVTNSLGYSTTQTVTVHIANPADSMTLLHLEFTPGGAEHDILPNTVTSAEQTFVPTMTPSSMTMRIGGYSLDSLLVSMAAPATSSLPLQAGSYNNALQALSLFPALDSSDSGDTRCYGGTLTGRFVILAIQADSNNLISLAADFDEYCSDGSALHGVLRYNSMVPLDAPEADAGGTQDVSQSSVVTLSASTSYAGSATENIASYQWTQLSGPSVTLSDPTAAAPTFTAPPVSPGGADLVFQLTVTNTSGLTDTDQVTVHIFNPVDPRSLLHITSDAGDPVGQGQTFDYDELNALFSFQTPGYPYQGDGNAKLGTVTYSSNIAPQPGQWTLEFMPILNQLLQAGSYDQAQLANSFGDISALPGLNVTKGYQSCNGLTGRFDILDIQTDQNGNITSLAVDFEQACTGATGSLHGQLRYNSAVPLNVPFADVGVPQQLADPGNVVTLGGSNSDPGADGATISSYQWVQVSGPSVTLSDPSGATTTFTSPDVPLGGADLTFQLTVTNSDGVSSTSTVTVHVGNPNDAKTRLYAKSDAQDPLGNGQTFDLRPTNALFSVSSTSSNGAANNAISFTATTGAEGTGNNWTVFMEAPTGQSLKVGTHYAFTPFQSGLSSFSASPSEGGDCGSVSGLFVIRDLKTDQNGNITNFAADFIQHCNAGAPALVGWVRYNSTMPIDTPIVDTGTPQSTYSGFPITLDGSGSRAAPNETFSYSWTQVVAKGDPVISLSDPTAAKPMFLAPDVALGGRTLTFKLTIANNTDLTDANTVNVTIGNEEDPKTVLYFESDPGDPIENGGSGLVLSANAGFIAQFFPGFADIRVFGEGTGPLPGQLELGFQTPFPPGLKTGTYVSTSQFSGAQLDAEVTGVPCDSPDGLFIIRDIEKAKNGQISGFGADFVQHCSGATGTLRGAIRYNSPTPILINEPTADPGPSQNLTQAGTVTLSGVASFPGWGTIVSTQWKQVGGPRVTLANADTITPSFSLPAKLLANGGSTLTFQLTVKNSLGLSSTNNVTITAKEPTTVSLTLQSDAGDPVGGGQTATYGFTPTSVKLQSQAKLGVSASLSGNGNWTLDFVGPIQQGLQVGTYSNATLFKRSPGKTPLMDVSTASAQCKTVTGSFTVLDVIYGAGNTLDSLAVDFVQHCNGIGPALHGKFRYHSAVP